MLRVEETLSVYLTTDAALSLKILILLTKPCHVTSSLVGRAYMAADQACLETWMRVWCLMPKKSIRPLIYLSVPQRRWLRPLAAPWQQWSPRRDTSGRGSFLITTGPEGLLPGGNPNHLCPAPHTGNDKKGECCPLHLTLLWS